MRSVIDVGRWVDCAALVAEATARALPTTCYVLAGPRSRIDVVLANCIRKHALCDVGLVGATGIPTHLPGAAVFQLAEYEQMVTTIVRMKKIEPEAEELTADRAVAHIHQNAAWTWATQQRNVQRFWEPWCESGEAHLHKRTKQEFGTVKAHTGRGQVRLKALRRRATAPSAHESRNLVKDC